MVHITSIQTFINIRFSTLDYNVFTDLKSNVPNIQKCTLLLGAKLQKMLNQKLLKLTEIIQTFILMIITQCPFSRE